MKQLFIAAIFCAAFLVSTPALTVEQCATENSETVLTEAIKESPELLVKELTGADLLKFWAKLTEMKFMDGLPDIDKVYVFKSENHPDNVYVFFLKQGCIVDVKFTLKKIIEGAL